MTELERWTSEDATKREKALLTVARRVGASAAARARIAGALGIGVGVVTTGAAGAGAAKGVFGGLGLFAKIMVGVGVVSLIASGSWYASSMSRGAPVVYVATTPNARQPVLGTTTSSTRQPVTVATTGVHGESASSPHPPPRPSSEEGRSEIVVVRAMTTIATARVDPPLKTPTEGALSPVAASTLGTAVLSASREAGAHLVTNAEPSPLDDELALLESAQEALGRHRADEALATLATHAERHPRGTLVIERNVLRIEALAQLGRSDDATREAHAFVREHPKSPSAARVTSLLRDLDAGL